MSQIRSAVSEGVVSPKLIGAGFMLLWALSFSSAMAFAKTLSPEINSIVVIFMRYFFGLIFFSPFLLQTGFKGFITSRPLLHFIRIICILKYNHSGSKNVYWFEVGSYANEPLFVPHPRPLSEDDGVILSVINNLKDQKAYLLILDAKDFKELARVDVPHFIPFGFHGQFFKEVLDQR